MKDLQKAFSICVCVFFKVRFIFNLVSKLEKNKINNYPTSFNFPILLDKICEICNKKKQKMEIEALPNPTQSHY